MGRGQKRNRHKTHLTPREREAYEALERNLSTSRNKAPAGKEADFVEAPAVARRRVMTKRAGVCERCEKREIVEHHRSISLRLVRV